jgi:hypothetical protein
MDCLQRGICRKDYRPRAERRGWREWDWRGSGVGRKSRNRHTFCIIRIGTVFYINTRSGEKGGKLTHRQDEVLIGYVFDNRLCHGGANYVALLIVHRSSRVPWVDGGVCEDIVIAVEIVVGVVFMVYSSNALSFLIPISKWPICYQ